jgi:hypothetical protein
VAISFPTQTSSEALRSPGPAFNPEKVEVSSPVPNVLLRGVLGLWWDVVRDARLRPHCGREDQGRLTRKHKRPQLAGAEGVDSTPYFLLPLWAAILPR